MGQRTLYGYHNNVHSRVPNKRGGENNRGGWEMPRCNNNRVGWNNWGGGVLGEIENSPFLR